MWGVPYSMFTPSCLWDFLTPLTAFWTFLLQNPVLYCFKCNHKAISLLWLQLLGDGLVTTNTWCKNLHFFFASTIRLTSSQDTLKNWLFLHHWDCSHVQCGPNFFKTKNGDPKRSHTDFKPIYSKNWPKRTNSLKKWDFWGEICRKCNWIFLTNWHGIEISASW